MRAAFAVVFLCVCLVRAASEKTSIATRVAPGDYPLNLLEVNGRYLLSTNNGYGTQYLQAYDASRRLVTGKLELPSLWFGLAYEPDNKLVVASDGKSGIYMAPFHDGAFGKPQSLEISGCKLTAGLVVRDHDTAIVACNQNHQIVEFDLRNGSVRARLSVGEFPFVLTMVPKNRLAVSNLGQSSVTLVGLSDLNKVAEIPVGSHPNQMLVLPDARTLVVSCSDSDSVSLIDLESLREIRRIDLRPPGSKLTGVQPNALAYANGRLFVALAAVSGVAVFQVEQEKDLDIRFEGVIPAGSFPTALSYSRQAKTLFIANGRNDLTGPNAPVRSGVRPFQYIAEILGGGIEALSDTEFNRYHPRLQSLAERIYGGRKETQHAREHRPPIKYVFYVIKENRTYDQVLGDMAEGNGSPELVLFGEKVTPNHHALAREY